MILILYISNISANSIVARVPAPSIQWKYSYYTVSRNDVFLGGNAEEDSKFAIHHGRVAKKSLILRPCKTAI